MIKNNENNENKIIKNNIRKYRIWKTLTREQLSEIIGIATNTLYSIEMKNSYPKYQVREKFCKYFNVSQDQLFYYE